MIILGSIISTGFEMIDEAGIMVCLAHEEAFVGAVMKTLSLSSARNIDSTRLRARIEGNFEQTLQTNPDVGEGKVNWN